MIKVLIADDHAIVRSGLKQILDETSGEIQVQGEAANGREVLEKIHAQDWDVLVLDITMPGRSGLDILKDIRQLKPKLPILILSMHAEEQFATRMLKAGASGYLNTESAP
jgi:DNA-binding NarL/FixJ family response regulator